MTEATLQTNHGPIRIELFPEHAPKTVQNFEDLARKGFYDGLTFHRIVKDFVIQGGDPKGDGSGGPGYHFAIETSPKVTFDSAGLLAYANSGPDTNGSQFFITLAPTPWLDNKHSVFGEVVTGMDVVSKIGKTATSKPGDRPVKPITLESVTIERK